MKDRIEKEVKSAVATLGTTIEEVLSRLRETRMKGTRGATSTCPIANYLRHVIGTHDYVTVTDVAVWRDWDLRAENAYVRVSTPTVVGEFIRRFDKGWYPEFDHSPL